MHRGLEATQRASHGVRVLTSFAFHIDTVGITPLRNVVKRSFDVRHLCLAACDRTEATIISMNNPLHLLDSLSRPAIPSIHHSSRYNCHIGSALVFLGLHSGNGNILLRSKTGSRQFAPQLPTSNSLSLASSAPSLPLVSAQPLLPGPILSLARRRLSTLTRSCGFRSHRSGETDGVRPIIPVPTRTLVCPHFLLFLRATGCRRM